MTADPPAWRWTALSIAFAVSVGVSGLTFVASFALGSRRANWARAALVDAVRLLVEAKIGPHDELPPDIAKPVKARLARLHHELWVIWWSRFIALSVFIGALLAGAAGSSLGGRPVVAFVLGAVLGGLYVGAVSGAYSARFAKQGQWMTDALAVVAKTKPKAASEWPFTVASLSTGCVDQQLGGFVRLAKAYAEQPTCGSAQGL